VQLRSARAARRTRVAIGVLAMAWCLIAASPADALQFVTEWGGEGAVGGTFETPLGIGAGNTYVYVADTGNDRIQQFDGSGTFIRAWGSFGPGNGEFSSPGDVAVGPTGDVYVADSNNNRIQRFDSAGNFISQWRAGGIGQTGIVDPTGVAVDQAGNVYVVDAGNHLVQKFGPSGAFIAKWGGEGTGAGQFGTMAGIGVDASGTVFVVDSGNDRIERFDSNGTLTGQWGAHGTADGFFDRPYDVAPDGTGAVHVTDMGNHRVETFTTSGAFIGTTGHLGAAVGEFQYPSGISADSSANVFVADTYNHRVQGSAPRTAIIVRKVSIPKDPQAFDFTTGGGISPSTFQLDDDGSPSTGFPPIRSFAVQPGSGYSVSETVPPGWDQLSATCSDGSPVSNIDVSQNENVTCTFTNQKRGRIVIVQDSQPDDPQAFTFTAGGGLSPSSFTLDDDGNNADGISNTQAFDNVVPGSGYSVTQATPAGWGAAQVTCSNGSSPTNINVAPGETVTCTFANLSNDAGRIVVVKDARPDSGQRFDFTTGGGLSPPSFQLDDDGNNNDALPNSRTFAVRAGSGYSVAEPSQPTGWTLDSATCSNGSSPNNITVASQETVTCTFVDGQHTHSYPRPRGATPMAASLVPAYKRCTSPTATHGAPLAYPSCPVAVASSYLTMGTPDSNGATANAMGSLKMTVTRPTSGSGDIAVSSQMTDVRCVPATAPGVCNSANATDGPDYSGQLQANTIVRLTDMSNATAQTVVDIPFPFSYGCANTAGTSVGGTCTAATSANAVVPGMVKAGERAIWGLDQMQVFDGGADGNTSTADNTLFLTQGVFVP
jgi:hypothetical protein